MYDHYKRPINYLRISVTDRCNLRCNYCMPTDGVKLMSLDDILSFEEIEDFTRLAVSKGINKVRLTGGEPLVRKDIITLVKRLAAIEGLEDLSMTTNGILLEQFAGELKAAGLKRVNISLDTVNPDRYCEITRTGNIQQVFKGIESAQKVGFDPIKINCVLLAEPDEEILRLKQYCTANKLDLRFIHQMDLQNGEFSKVEGGEGGNCNRCNRIRLLANGDVKPCLFSDLAYNIRQVGHEKALDLSIANKPKSGTFNKSGEFYNIGG
ncbi:GTP 3',8-cyclase MoaA [Mangrovibacterium lignilyticum]|uniref:GTP 3',8-cyclase MoaA n=1 Tax=Mangrovibacterium lignilyticum TaxID=2668052 RepID=UPI0013D1887A|nr:radical SAM protein [Mangrovibacterium lignilyticum]